MENVSLKLIVTTHTLFLYHVNSYESENFSKSEASVSLVLAKLFNAITCGLWTINVPETVVKIGLVKNVWHWMILTKNYIDLPKANHSTDDIHKDFDHDHLQLGFQFLADMINRFMFFIIILVQDWRAHSNLFHWSIFIYIYFYETN